VGIYGQQPERQRKDHGRRRREGAQFQGQVRVPTRVDDERVPQSEESVQHHEGRGQPRLQGLRNCHAD